MSPEFKDVLIKALLALFGGVVGAAGKTFVDTYRAKAILPVLLEQTKIAAEMGKRAISTGEAKTSGAICDGALRGVSELVALGVRPRRRWTRTAELLLAISVQASIACTCEGDACVDALNEFRARSQELWDWIISIL